MIKENCPRCGVPPGSMHDDWCVLEQCANCGRWGLSCFCDPEVIAVRLPWTGEWPGLAECREFGWYSRRAPKGWVSCERDHPEAAEDLNRLLVEAEWDPLQMRFIKRDSSWVRNR
jgi:hypothetical protein